MAKKKKKKKGAGRGSVAIIVLLLLIAMTVQTKNRYEKYQSVVARETQLQAELEAELARQEALKEQESNLDTKEYTEKEAHTKLGMLYENETVYREE